MKIRRAYQTSYSKCNSETKQLQVDTLLDLQLTYIREAGVSWNGKIAKAIVWKIYNIVIYNVGGHAGHIVEEIVTKISETHNT